MVPKRHPRVLFHVQHLLGIGHQVRAGAIATAMHAAGLEVHVAQGGSTQDAGAPSDGIHLHALPAARSADASFSGLVTETGEPVDDAWRNARRRRLMEIYHDVRPDLVLVEGFPFARRQFGFELKDLVETARLRVPVAVSVRDILVEKKKPGREEEIAQAVNAGFDRVLVHGDPAFVRLEDSFRAADRITDKLVYTGYVVQDPPAGDAAEPDGQGEIVVSVGGGAVGGPILRAAVAAAGMPALAGRRWRLLLGPNLPADDLAALASPPAGFVVEPARKDFRSLLRRAALSVSQAGYNTMMDLSVAGCRAVLVPFAGTGETEQPLRAALAERRGWAAVVPEAALTPERLAAAIADRLAGPPPGIWPLDRDGAARTAAVVREMALSPRDAGNAAAR